MRGRQIAACRDGWQATLEPSKAELMATDAVVIVKRVKPEILAMVKASGLPIIYDPLDFWHQPKSFWQPRSRAQKITSGEEAAGLFQDHFATYDPDLILCVTRQMADDLGQLGYPTSVLYHHADPRLPNVAEYARNGKGQGKTLLYFGNRKFLRGWAKIVGVAAKSVGVDFITLDSSKGGFSNPPAADAMIAVRGGRDGCWLSRAWKSNVKAATAAELGLPLVAWPEAAYRETTPEAYWFDSRARLTDAIEQAVRVDARIVSQRFTVEGAACDYECIIGAVLNGERPGPVYKLGL